MRWPRVAFVAAPEVDAEVRFDFNDDLANTYPAADNFSLGVPDPLGDPDGIGVEYGLRTLSFTLVVENSRAEALRAQSGLAREVLRRTNWLLFQLDETSAPVWFKTWRAEPGDLSFEHVYNERGRDHWQVGVEIPAEPFAYGERVELPPVTVANNPASPTSPMSFRVDDVKGDAPAPLSFATYPDSLIRSRLLVSSIAVDEFSGPAYVSAAAFDGSIFDTGAFVADASYASGGYREVTFSTYPTMQPRVSGNFTGHPPGEYRVLARVVRTDTSSAFDLRCDSGDLPGRSTVRLSGTSEGQWGTLIDFGVFSFPAGGVRESTFPLAPAFGTTTVLINAARVSGTGSLRFDYLLAVPVTVGDEAATTLITEFVDEPFYGGTQSAAFFDGEHEVVAFGATPLTSSELANAEPPTARGGFPRLSPGKVNVVHVLPHVDSTVVVGATSIGVRENRDLISETTRVLHLSYQPRHLYLGSD